jgi:hypothetical protein
MDHVAVVRQEKHYVAALAVLLTEQLDLQAGVSGDCGRHATAADGAFEDGPLIAELRGHW